MKLSSKILNLAASLLAVNYAIAEDPKPTSDPSALQPFDQKEVEAGRAAARADISKHLIRYAIIGQPSQIDSELKRLAATKYNISVTFHGCCAGPRVDYDRAYLDVVITYLKAFHGFDPIATLEKELRTLRVSTDCSSTTKHTWRY